VKEIVKKLLQLFFYARAVVCVIGILHDTTATTAVTMYCIFIFFLQNSFSVCVQNIVKIGLQLDNRVAIIKGAVFDSYALLSLLSDKCMTFRLTLYRTVSPKSDI